jgi:hypothetical protein
MDIKIREWSILMVPLVCSMIDDETDCTVANTAQDTELNVQVILTMEDNFEGEEEK